MTFEEIKKKLSDKVVGVAGAGGLGSNAAVALARIGIGKLIIADFDVITESNLNRQYYFFKQIGKKKVVALKDNLKKINPRINIEIHDLKLDKDNIPEIFKNCDAIIEAFDKAEMKKMIIETVIRNMPEMPLVCGIGLAGYGNLELIDVKKFDNIYICGDMVSETSEENPPLAPKVAVVANMQADIVALLLINK